MPQEPKGRAHNLDLGDQGKLSRGTEIIVGCGQKAGTSIQVFLAGK